MCQISATNSLQMTIQVKHYNVSAQGNCASFRNVCHRKPASGEHKEHSGGMHARQANCLPKFITCSKCVTMCQFDDTGPRLLS